MSLTQFLFLILSFQIVASAPRKDSNVFTNEEGINLDEDKWNMNIILKELSLRYPVNVNNKIDTLPDIDYDNKYFKTLLTYMTQGITAKGTVFTVYNDEMREAAIALFKLLKSLEKEDRIKVEKWGQRYINSAMYDYAKRIYFLFGDEDGTKYNEENPEFIRHPNHFVPSKVISKAFSINFLQMLKKDFTDPDISYLGSYTVIDSNYTNWDKIKGDSDGIDYLTEDVSFNAHFYGTQLCHPFWMSDTELKEFNPRHNEHLMFSYSQIISRYVLELYSIQKCTKHFMDDYNPYLINDIGEEFPIRKELQDDCNEEMKFIESLDATIRETISKGVVVLENGTIVNLTEDNDIDLLVYTMRSNLESVKVVNRIRNYLGLGVPPSETSVKTPTILHFPETMIRDPLTISRISSASTYLDIYLQSKATTDFRIFENKNYKITDFTYTKIITYFENYVFDITRVLTEHPVLHNHIPAPLAVKQRRFNTNEFTFSLNIFSKVNNNVTIRYFIVPACHDCCNRYNIFFQLEQSRVYVGKGENVVTWNSKYCFHCSNDDYFNLNKSGPKQNEYDMFKFPRRLLMPRGYKDGLNLTLFVIVTEDDMYDAPVNNYNNQVFKDQTTRPLGFPFHRPIKNCDYLASNYRFINITVYHSHDDIN